MATAQTTAERIRQRRQQIAVHSYLYYQLDSPIVSDDTWQRWSNELVTLQRDFTGRVLFYDRAFFDWDGSTGMHLPKDAWIAEKAAKLLRQHEHYQAAPAIEKAPPAPAARAPAPPPPIQASLF